MENVNTAPVSSAVEAGTFAERLKQARTEKGLTLAQLGNLVDCGHQRLWNYENRGDDCGSEMCFRLADALAVEPRWLATGDAKAATNVALDPVTLGVARALAVLPKAKRDAIAVMLGVTFEGAVDG